MSKIFKTLFSTKASVQNFIESIEYSYSKHRAHFPGENQHFHLMQAWLAYMQAKGANVDDPAIHEAAFTTTYQLACIPHPDCAKALGIFLCYRERPNDIDSETESTFNSFISPVMEAQEKGTLEELFKKYNRVNPTMGK